HGHALSPLASRPQRSPRRACRPVRPPSGWRDHAAVEALQACASDGACGAASFGVTATTIGAVAPTKRPLAARIPADLYDALERRAAAEGVSVTSVVEAALKGYLAVTPTQRARHMRDELARLVADLERGND